MQMFPAIKNIYIHRKCFRSYGAKLNMIFRVFLVYGQDYRLPVSVLLFEGSWYPFLSWTPPFAICPLLSLQLVQQAVNIEKFILLVKRFLTLMYIFIKNFKYCELFFQKMTNIPLLTLSFRFFLSLSAAGFGVEVFEWITGFITGNDSL